MVQLRDINIPILADPHSELTQEQHGLLLGQEHLAVGDHQRHGDNALGELVAPV